MDLPALRRHFAWTQTWQRYLERYVTDENLEKYFEQNRRHFDGSQLRVSHILFAAENAEDPESLNAAIQKSRQVRKSIEDGTLSFAEAAAQHSNAPTAKEGGDIGFIGRHEPMPEAFSKAAFSLEKGKISEPVVTVFGVHLIQWTDHKPGQRTWFDARRELEESITQYLFRRLADRHREEFPVEFTSTMPYFKPGTNEVVPGQ
jgi:parvulin-like peptidyl-prolyl isomerase